jgi:hypothetical protein
MYMDRHYEFETAPRAGFDASLTATVTTHKIVPYVKMGFTSMHLLSAPEFLDGASRNTITLTLGCNF